MRQLRILGFHGPLSIDVKNLSGVLDCDEELTHLLDVSAAHTTATLVAVGADLNPKTDFNGMKAHTS